MMHHLSDPSHQDRAARLLLHLILLASISPLNSGVSASTPEPPPELLTGRAPVFLCLTPIRHQSDVDLIAKAAMDRRIADIVTPVIEGHGV